MPTARRSAVVAATTAAYAALAVLLYATAQHAYAGDSDRATLVLEGQALAGGHLLLHGWSLPYDSFWTLDAAVHAILYRVFGMSVGLLYSGQALIGAAVIATGASLAAHGRSRGAAIVGGAVVVALLGFSTPALAFFFTGYGFHVESCLCALVVFGLLQRQATRRRVALAAAVLALGLLGDLEVVAFAVIPLLLGSVMAGARLREWRAGRAQATVAVVGSAAALLLHFLERALGGFTSTKPVPLAPAHQIILNLHYAEYDFLSLIGVKPGLFGSEGVPVGLRAAQAAGGCFVIFAMACALAGLVLGVVRGSGGEAEDSHSEQSEHWRMDDLLLFGMLGAGAVYVALSLTSHNANVRYLAISAIFAVVLAGRTAARLWSEANSRRAMTGAALAGAVVLCCYASATGVYLSRSAPRQPVSALASWLVRHDLHKGIGDYWSASITTVVSGDDVEVRPVRALESGRIVPTSSMGAAQWYTGSFQFLVYDPTHWDDIDATTAKVSFGVPEHTYEVGKYTVLVWSHPLSVSP